MMVMIPLLASRNLWGCGSRSGWWFWSKVLDVFRSIPCMHWLAIYQDCLLEWRLNVSSSVFWFPPEVNSSPIPEKGQHGQKCKYRSCEEKTFFWSKCTKCKNVNTELVKNSFWPKCTKRREHDARLAPNGDLQFCTRIHLLINFLRRIEFFFGRW